MKTTTTMRALQPTATRDDTHWWRRYYLAAVLPTFAAQSHLTNEKLISRALEFVDCALAELERREAQ